MSIVSSRTELTQPIAPTIKTGLRWLTSNNQGVTIESNEQVLVADLSTQSLGGCKGATVSADRLMKQAVNTLEDNTGT